MGVSQQQVPSEEENEVGITPEELVGELQYTISQLTTQLAVQNILIRKLKGGSDAQAGQDSILRSEE